MRYLYKCKACENQQEAEHSIHDNPVIKCSNCGSEDTARVLQARPFILQNGGWFKDSYK
jgi:putative FmdB family regulatory protein